MAEHNDGACDGCAVDEREATMKKLIVHIEWGDSVQLSTKQVDETLSKVLGNLFGNAEGVYSVEPDSGGEGADAGWRFFESLDEAMDWEMSEPNIEVALRLVGHLRRMIGKMADMPQIETRLRH